MPFLCLLVSAAAGALTTFGLAPFPHWWLAIFCVAVLAYNLSHGNPKLSLQHSFFFGLGHFATGVSWVYISIHEFGHAPVPLAAVMTLIFVVFLAIVFALPFYCIKWMNNPNQRLLLGFPLLWGVSEWLRSWLLTGFPWLYVGYGHIGSPLIGWAPLGGVLFVGLISVITSSLLCYLVIKRNYLIPILAISCLWGSGYALSNIQWTDVAGDKIKVGIVQPNVPLEEKWDPRFRLPIADKLWGLSEPLWQENDWVIWPEAAIPDLYFRSTEFLNALNLKAKATDTSLVTGILYDDVDNGFYYNSVIGLGDASGIYFKQRLVPFGEYVPLETWLRGLIDFFDLPNSVIHPGKSEQENLILGDYRLAASICYEIVYPGLVAKQLNDAHAIVTISNDAWFGESIGPLQHFHMARMRAIETGRYVIRGTNNGVSAIIAPDGHIQTESAQFVATAIQGTIEPMSGSTPYLKWRDNLFLVILGVLLALVIITNPLTVKQPTL